MEALLMGARGWVAGLVNAFPRETVAIHRLIMGGKIEEARRIYRWFAPLLHLDVSRKLVQNIKLAESTVGVGTEAVRPPRLPLVGQEREEIIAIGEAGAGDAPGLAGMRTIEILDSHTAGEPHTAGARGRARPGQRHDRRAPAGLSPRPRPLAVCDRERAAGVGRGRGGAVVRSFRRHLRCRCHLFQ